MIRKFYKPQMATSRHSFVYGIHTSMGDRIRTSLENGVSETPTTPAVFDDADSNSIDPLSDIRTDKWEQIEMAQNKAYYDSIATPEVDTTLPTSEPTNTPNIETIVE